MEMNDERKEVWIKEGEKEGKKRDAEVTPEGGPTIQECHLVLTGGETPAWLQSWPHCWTLVH